MLLSGRTDLASEAHEKLGSLPENIEGLRLRREKLYGLSLSSVEVTGDEAAGILGKPKGKYFTLELEGRFERGSENFPRCANAVAELISRCMGNLRSPRTLVAALGNPDITPDALGPIAASHTLVTRHLKTADPENFRPFASTSLCRTGVLGTSGIESAAQIKNLCDLIQPELVIVVDALAGSDVEKLCRCIQICDSGISPGSGVGNDRESISPEYLGIPMIAIGVPTVIDASSFSNDDSLRALFVTPRDIDSLVRSAGRLVAYGINLALHEGLSIGDVDMLVG